ncbi:glycosyltransferase family 39 protein [Companilactobacillus metriopterae]|uniref:glycosyltransferase family 39 protein n=1 Tax=Companilactobacillus metriopterae TaxID=1909267 RepID=UPI00100AD312|nr:glycosyltransferase family 39 protein [Companilactobacillus metriopterae]
MLKKTQNIISNIVLACLFLFTTAVLVRSAQYLYKVYLTTTPRNYWIVLIFAILAVLFVSYFLYRIRIDSVWLNWTIIGIILLIFVGISIWWLGFVPKQQFSDFAGFWSNAPGALKGEKLYSMDNDYFAKWAYQTGFLTYVMLVVKIFGAHILAIQLLNVFYQVVILVLVYLLVIEIFDNIKMARIATFILMIDLDWFALSSQTNNQYIGTMFFLLTFYLILKNKYWSYAVAGVTLGIGSVVRPIGPVIIAGIVVFVLIYQMFKDSKFDLSSLYKLAITLLLYLVIFNGASALIKSSGLNEYGLSNRDSEWKFVVGLDYNSAGAYDSVLASQFNMKDSRAEMAKQEKIIVKQESKWLTDNNKWLPLFWNKNAIMWAKRSNATDFTGYYDSHKLETINWTNYVAYLGSILIILFSFIGSLRLFKLRYNHKGMYLLILPLMAYVVIELLIEVQGRYRIEFVPILAIIASVGIEGIIQIIKNNLTRKEKQID